MLTVVKTLAHRVFHYLHRPSSLSASDVARASDDERLYLSQTSLVYTSEGGQSRRYPSSEEGDSQLVSLIPIATAQTSMHGSFIIDTSIATKQTNFPIASGGLGDVYKCILNQGASAEEVCHRLIFSIPMLIYSQVAVKSPRFPSLADADVAKINRVCLGSLRNCCCLNFISMEHRILIAKLRSGPD
jgi:hypothetical protein